MNPGRRTSLSPEGLQWPMFEMRLRRRLMERYSSHVLAKRSKTSSMTSTATEA